MEEVAIISSVDVRPLPQLAPWVRPSSAMCRRRSAGSSPWSRFRSSRSSGALGRLGLPPPLVLGDVGMAANEWQRGMLWSNTSRRRRVATLNAEGRPRLGLRGGIARPRPRRAGDVLKKDGAAMLGLDIL